MYYNLFGCEGDQTVTHVRIVYFVHFRDWRRQSQIYERNILKIPVVFVKELNCSKVGLLKVEFSGLSGDDTKAFMVLVRLRHLKTACLFFRSPQTLVENQGCHFVLKGDTRSISTRSE